MGAHTDALSHRSWKLFGLACAAMSAVLAFLCVTLSQRVRAMRTHVAQLENERFMALTADKGLKIGDRVTDLVSMHSGVPNSTLRLSSVEKPTFVLLVGKDCPTCKALAPLWAQVAKKLQDSGLDTVVIDAQAKNPIELSVLPPPLVAHCIENIEKTWVNEVPVIPSAMLVQGDGEVRWLRRTAIVPGEVDSCVNQVLAAVK